MCLDVCVHPYPLLLSPVSCEIVHRDFHALALFEFAQGVCQQIKVKGVGVVEVVVVTGGQSLLFWGQDLRDATMLELLHSKHCIAMITKTTRAFFVS